MSRIRPHSIQGRIESDYRGSVTPDFLTLSRKPTVPDQRRQTTPNSPQRLRFLKASDGGDSQRDERYKCDALCDGERPLGLRRGQRFQRGHFLEELHDEDEEVEVERDEGSRRLLSLAKNA